MLMVVFNILVDLLKLDSKIIIQFQKLYLKEVFREIQREYEITHLYINLACLSVWVSVCLFVSNKRQNG